MFRRSGVCFEFKVGFLVALHGVRASGGAVVVCGRLVVGSGREAADGKWSSVQNKWNTLCWRHDDMSEENAGLVNSHDRPGDCNLANKL